MPTWNDGSISLNDLSINKALSSANHALIYGTQALGVCYDLCNSFQNAIWPDPFCDVKSNNFYGGRVSRGPVSDKAFAHIHGDNYVGSTNLEGWNSISSKETLEDFAQDFSDDIQKKILDFTKKIEYIPAGLGDSYRVEEFAGKMAGKIKSLKPNEELWLEGGANNHAMFYQFIKRPGGKYDIYIYNTGEGIQYHYREPREPLSESSLTIDPKLSEEVAFQTEYVCPFVKFEGVLESEIGLDIEGKIDPALFVNLISIATFRQASGKEAVKRIYEEVFGALNHRRIQDPRTRDDFILITPQRSGTCAWRVLAYAALKAKLADSKQSEIVDLHIKQASFEASCHEGIALDRTATSKELCIQGGQELLRQLAGLHEVFLTHEEVEARRQSIQKALDVLRSSETIIPQVKEMPPVSCQEVPHELSLSSASWKLYGPEKEISKEIIPFSAQPMQTVRLEDVQKELQKIIDFRGEDHLYDIPMQVERLVISLPNPLTFTEVWANASPQTIQECQNLFSEVLALYTKIIIAHNGRLLREQNTAWGLFAAIHYLSGRIDNDLVSKYGIYYKSFEQLIKNSRFTNFSPDDLKRYLDLVSYFKSTVPESQLFAIEHVHDRLIKHDTPLLPDETLLLSLARKHTNIDEELQEKVRARQEESFYKKHSISESRIAREIVLWDNELFAKYPETSYIANLRKAAHNAQSFTHWMQRSLTPEKLQLITQHSDEAKAVRIQHQNVVSFNYRIPDQDKAFKSGLVGIEGSCLFQRLSELHENQRVADQSYVPSRLEAATCQKTLQSQLIIDHFKDNIADLSEEGTQNLFLLSLFRSFSSGMPIQEAIVDPAFIRAVFKFVDKGMSLFLHGRKRPDIKTTLFFMQVVRRLKELDPTLPLFQASEIKEFSDRSNPPERFLPDYTSEINELLKRDDLTEEEENSLHIHRILQYTTQKDHLNALTTEETSQNRALQEIIESWMSCSSFKFPRWHSFHSQSEAAHFIYDLAPVFEKLSPQFLTPIINHLVPDKKRSFTSFEQKQCPSSLPAGKTAPSSFYYTSNEEGTWSVSPLHGKILRNGEELTFGVQKDFTEQPEYKKLFGSEKFKMTKQGSAFVFQNTEGKRFRIFQRGSIPIIQLEWNGKWYQYLRGDDISEKDFRALLKEFPKHLIAERFLFRSDDELLFVHRNTFDVDFSGVRGTVTDGSSRLYRNEGTDFYSSLERFEQKPWILEKMQKDDVFKVRLPRFKSLTGDVLEFTKTPRGLSWNGDFRFLLKEAPKGFLGLNFNYLFVQSGEKSKILVPCKPMERSEEFAPHADIDIKDGFRTKEYALAADHRTPLYTGELSSPQEGVYRFLEYDIENGKAIPLTSEGAFYLSYLFLAQKDYVKALHMMQESLKLKEHLTISPESRKILTWMMQHPIHSYDRSSSATALGLRAARFLLADYAGFSGNNPDDAMQAMLDETLPNLWRSYQNGIAEVQSDLRFSGKEIKELFQSYRRNWMGSYYGDDWPRQRDVYVSYPYNLVYFMESGRSIALEFKEVYNAFQRAKTESEKTFLKMKHWKFLTSHEFRACPAMAAVILGDGSKFTPYPERDITEESASKWLDQFSAYERASFAIAKGRMKDNVPQKITKASMIARPLVESLHRVKSESLPDCFVLPAVSLTNSLFLDSLVKDSFVQKLDSQRTRQISSDLFSKREVPPLYKMAVEQERSDFLQEYDFGLAKNQKEIRYGLKSGVSVDAIREKLQFQWTEYSFQIKNLRTQISDLVNKLPDDQKKRTLALLLNEGLAQSKVEMHQVVNAFLDGNSQGYSDLNSHLTENEIKTLDDLTKAFLILSIESSQIEKALHIQDPQELGQMLSAGIAYLDPKYEHLTRQFLVYEYRSGLRMREEQVSLILTMSQEKSCVTQLMMGGGKTSVIASNLLYLAAKPGRIVFFIPPAAQISTLIENLGNMQKKHFHQGVIPIQLQRSQLTLKNLKLIKESFESAKKDRKIILTTRETIESLNLEYLDLLSKKNDFSKLNLLSSLIKEMKMYGDALIDEVDLILNPMQETNFPLGERMPIRPDLIEMTRQLFKLLISHPKLRLGTNEQALLSESAHRKILLDVFTQFFDEYTGFSLEPSEKESFLKFVQGSPPPRSFKKVLELRSKSEGLKNSAEGISLMKHLSTDVLPLTLSKSTGESYGRVLDEDVVGPYHGVASPSFTEFGSQWEAMLYHFQTVLSKGVTVNQVKELYESFFAAASYQVSSVGAILEDTWEAQMFKTLTGFSLVEFNNPGNFERAVEKINNNQDLQLLLEANTIAQVVGSYVQYLRSTSQNFVENFSGFDSFSGTPWNVESYPKSLQEGFYPDRGTEGKILDVFLERSKTTSKIHTTDICNPAETLTSVLHGMIPERQKRLSGFIDSAGLFKESDGLSVAKEILAFYQNEDRIQTVLFFGRPNTRSPMVLMALKKGAKTPIVVGGTQVQEIAKHGISLDSTFVYYDQTHCEATDILQKKDAINVISVNHRTIRRAFTQGVLRLRAYFKGQDVEVVLPKEEVEHFTGHADVLPTHKDVLVKIIDNQAVRKADQTFRSYKQKIDNALRQVAMDELIKARDIHSEFGIFERFKGLFVVHREEDLYTQFGAPEVLIDSLEALEEYRSWKEKFFQTFTTDAEVLQSAKSRLDQILESARKTAYRPNKVKRNAREDTGTEVELSQEVAVEVSVDTSLDRDLQRELDIYQNVGFIRPATEVQWTDEFVESSLKKTDYVDEDNIPPRVYSLRDMLLYRNRIPYKQEYFKLFGDNLLVSHNFIRSFDRLTSVFYKKQKHAGQVLIIKDQDQTQAILLSTLEAHFFKNYIRNKKPNNMWLVLPSGDAFIGKAPEMTPEIQDLLWQVKLLNGNVEELLKDPLTPKKRKRLNKKLLHDFLALKVEYNPRQRGVFYQHFVEQHAKSGDPLSFFRTASSSAYNKKNDNFERYYPLLALGISKKEIDAKSLDVREALFTYTDPLNKLSKAGLDLRLILDLPCGELVKILENTDKLIALTKKGLQWDTILRTLKPHRKKVDPV